MNLSTQDLQLIAQSLQLAEINHIDKDQIDTKIYVLNLIKRIQVMIADIQKDENSNLINE